MKFLRIFVVLLLTCTLLRADLVIVQDVDGMGQKFTMTMKTKGSLLRVDVNPQISVVMDAASGEMKTMMHDQKAFMTMNVDSMKGMIASANKSNAAGEAGQSIKALGNKEKINGYDTEEYLVTQGDIVSRVWIAKDYPHFDAFIRAMETLRKGPIGQMSPQMQMDLSQLPGMPLKTIVEMNGKPTATSILKSLEEKELDAAEFAPPADYKPFAMPQMPPANPGQ